MSVETQNEAHLGGPLRETAKVWTPEELPGVELLSAYFLKQNFNRHFHRRYAFGVIESGALGFHYLGRSHVAAAGEINLVVPGEVHDGRAAAKSGWRYRMFYLEPGILTRAAGEITDKDSGPPFFRKGVIVDPQEARRLHSLHASLEKGTPSLLEIESELLLTLTGLISRHSENRPRPRPVGLERGPVDKARAIIEDRYSENISLSDLAREAGLSRFHFLRAFKDRLGLPPHAYQTIIRVGRARELIRRGQSIADAAALSGFADQSHLNRHFKRTHGITPGQYRLATQAGRARPERESY
ncbi:MAG: AraC family transcriptional regulator [Pseudomonadota bacterium]